MFDVLLVVEEETVSKHSEGMRRSVKARAIICAPFIHIKLKSQTLCPIDGNMHWSESRLDLRALSWFVSTFGSSACLTAHQGLIFFFFSVSLCSCVSKGRVCVQCWQVSDIFIPLRYCTVYERDDRERRSCAGKPLGGDVSLLYTEIQGSLFIQYKVLIDSLLVYLIADLLFLAWANLWTNCGCQTVGQIHVPITRTVASTAAITATAPVTVTWQHTVDQVSAIHIYVIGHIIAIKIRSTYALLLLCIVSSSSWLHCQLWEPCRKHTAQFWDGHLQWREHL